MVMYFNAFFKESVADALSRSVFSCSVTGT